MNEGNNLGGRDQFFRLRFAAIFWRKAYLAGLVGAAHCRRDCPRCYHLHPLSQWQAEVLGGAPC